MAKSNVAASISRPSAVLRARSPSLPPYYSQAGSNAHRNMPEFFKYKVQWKAPLDKVGSALPSAPFCSLLLPSAPFCSLLLPFASIFALNFAIQVCVSIHTCVVGVSSFWMLKVLGTTQRATLIDHKDVRIHVPTLSHYG